VAHAIQVGDIEVVALLNIMDDAKLAELAQLDNGDSVVWCLLAIGERSLLPTLSESLADGGRQHEQLMHPNTMVVACAAAITWSARIA